MFALPSHDKGCHAHLDSYLFFHRAFMNPLLTVGIAPRRPVLLMSNSITTSSAIIQWTVLESFNPDFPEEFVILYGLSSEDLSQQSPVVTATSSNQTYSIQLNSLATGTEYHYRVSSRNEFTTDLSDARLFTTDDGRKLCDDLVALIYVFYITA